MLALIVSLSIASAATTEQAGRRAHVRGRDDGAAGAERGGDQGEVRRSVDHVRRRLGRRRARRATRRSRRSSRQQTGIKVKVVPHPAASDASYSQLARAFSSHSSSIDVAMIDVVWPGAFAPFLVDLKPKLGQQAKLHAQGIIQNDTVDGKLVAMPWFGDFGMLYYRTDLLKKYGYQRRRRPGPSSSRWRRRSRTASRRRTRTSAGSSSRATPTRA